MTESSRRSLDKATAERLLSGDFGVDSHLGALLSAAAEPTQVAATERASAVAAFQRGMTKPVSHRAPRRLEMIKKSLAASITAKLAVVAAAVLVATGGAALAAGKLPTPGDHPQVPTHNPSHTASPSPNFTGLCTAFAAGALDGGSGKSEESPAFSALIEAAGGEENLPAYCADLLGTPTEPADDTTDEDGSATDDDSGAEPGQGQATAEAHRSENAQGPHSSTHPTHPAHPGHPSQAQGPKSSDPGSQGKAHRPDRPEHAQRP